LANTEQLLDKLERIKILLTLYSTGKEGDNDEFVGLRKELLNSDRILKDKLPAFLRNNRTLAEFWAFIKPRFAHYAERREYLDQQFEPAFTYLDGLTLQSPVSAHRSEKEFLINANVDIWVTWAKVDNQTYRDGIETYLAIQLKPIIGSQHLYVLPISVNLPW